MAELSVYNPIGSQVMSRELNQSEYHFDRNMSRAPENVVTIFTVNTRPQFSASAKVMFAGREKGERYRKVGSITDPKYYVDDLSIEGSKNQKKVTADDGKWVAMDWLNPDNVFNLDQNYVVPSVDYSTNLLVRGLFFIVRPFDAITGNMNDQPTNAEVEAAERRLIDRYTQLVALYEKTNQSDPKSMPNIMSAEMVDALNYAGKKTPYNTTLESRKDCPTCGESIPDTAKFHKSEALGGVICIQPTVEAWKAAVAAGIRTREQASEAGFTWPGRSAS